ncbi:hypothetical protein Tco_0140832 [Tanacetum coccineum]
MISTVFLLYSYEYVFKHIFGELRENASGSPPRQPNRPVPAQCQSSSLRIETGNASLRKAFRHINHNLVTLGFDYDNHVEEIPGVINTQFSLQQKEKVVVGKKRYTRGERVRALAALKLRLLWRKNKNRIKAQHYTIYDSPEEAKNHLPPSTVWGERTHDEWNELVDWFSHPNQVSRSMKNAANRAKNTIPTHQGKKSFAQGRNEYKVEKRHHEDLI